MAKSGLHRISELVEAGFVSAGRTERLETVADRYAIAVPAHLRHRISLEQASGSKADMCAPRSFAGPLARQFIPDERELQAFPHEHSDPIGDDTHSPVKGIVHRYTNRVLLKIVHVCPVYCRFCFRRESTGAGPNAMLKDDEVMAALNYVSRHREIEEVIMTGGDPLVMSPRRIAHLTSDISEIGHVSKLRWHSRVPIVEPERISRELISALTATDRQVRIAVHVNHTSELTREAHRACHWLRDTGVQLLSQSVLLRGVNDDVIALSDLFQAFQDLRLRPYYIHQLDLAPGTQHFRVPIQYGKSLLNAVQQCNPKLPQPQYTLDIPGGFGKVSLQESHVRLIDQRQDSDIYRIRDPFGGVHIYPDIKTC